MFIKQESLRGDKRANNWSNCSENMEDSSQPRVNYNNHYHLGERNVATINIMSGVKSLVCDLNGIIIAEMVYRCMICDVIYDTIPEVQIHYQSKHIDEENHNNSQNHSNSLANTSLSSNANTSLSPNANTSFSSNANTTNVSFFGSFRSTSDMSLDNSTDSAPTNTLTFDVPSGLKTLQQQFQTPPKKKTIQTKSDNSVNSKSNSNSKINKTTFVYKSKGQILSSQTKSGFITCEICGATKFYKYLQRRFGVYSCVGCAKFYSKYLLKPVNYTCENLGNCNLKVSECEPNGRCKACLIHKCKSKFIIDPKKLLSANKILNISRSNDKKVFSEIKNKRNNKTIPGRDLSRAIKGKSSNSLPIDSKSKSCSTLSKVKIKEEDSLVSNKGSNSINSSKKVKQEKISQKITLEKNGIAAKSSPVTNSTAKSSPLTNSTAKTSIDNISTFIRGKRSSVSFLKSNGVKNVKKKRQTACRRCSGCRTKDCNACVNCLDKPRNGGKDKIRQKCIKRKCLNRSRNN